MVQFDGKFNLILIICIGCSTTTTGTTFNDINDEPSKRHPQLISISGDDNLMFVDMCTDSNPADVTIGCEAYHVAVEFCGGASRPQQFLEQVSQYNDEHLGDVVNLSAIPILSENGVNLVVNWTWVTTTSRDFNQSKHLPTVPHTFSVMINGIQDAHPGVTCFDMQIPEQDFLASIPTEQQTNVNVNQTFWFMLKNINEYNRMIEVGVNSNPDRPDSKAVAVIVRLPKKLADIEPNDVTMIPERHNPTLNEVNGDDKLMFVDKCTDPIPHSDRSVGGDVVIDCDTHHVAVEFCGGASRPQQFLEQVSQYNDEHLGDVVNLSAIPILSENGVNLVVNWTWVTTTSRDFNQSKHLPTVPHTFSVMINGIQAAHPGVTCFDMQIPEQDFLASIPKVFNGRHNRSFWFILQNINQYNTNIHVVVNSHPNQPGAKAAGVSVRLPKKLTDDQMLSYCNANFEADKFYHDGNVIDCNKQSHPDAYKFLTYIQGESYTADEDPNLLAFTFSFALAPPQFCFKKYLIRLHRYDNRKIDEQNNIYSMVDVGIFKNETVEVANYTRESFKCNYHKYTFHGLPPATYLVTIEPADFTDSGRCLCPIRKSGLHVAFSCRCQRARNMFSPLLSKPVIHDPTNVTATQYIEHNVNNNHNGNHNNLNHWTVIVVMLLGALCLVVAVGLCLLNRRCLLMQPAKATLVTVDQAGLEVTSSPSCPPLLLSDTVLTATANTIDPTVPRRVFVIYSHDSLPHERAVEALARFIENECACDVTLDIWSKDDVMSNKYDWINRGISECDQIIMVASEGSYKKYQCKMTSCDVLQRNNSDIFDDLFLYTYDALLQKSSHLSHSSLLIVHFARLNNTNDERYSRMPLFNETGLWRYMLPLHLNNLTSYLKLGKLMYPVDTESQYSTTAITPQGPYVVALKGKIKELHRYWTDYPNWFDRTHVRMPCLSGETVGIKSAGMDPCSASRLLTFPSLNETVCTDEERDSESAKLLINGDDNRSEAKSSVDAHDSGFVMTSGESMTSLTSMTGRRQRQYHMRPMSVLSDSGRVSGSPSVSSDGSLQLGDEAPVRMYVDELKESRSNNYELEPKVLDRVNDVTSNNTIDSGISLVSTDGGIINNSVVFTKPSSCPEVNQLMAME